MFLELITEFLIYSFNEKRSLLEHFYLEMLVKNEDGHKLEWTKVHQKNPQSSYLVLSYFIRDVCKKLRSRT